MCLGALIGAYDTFAMQMSLGVLEGAYATFTFGKCVREHLQELFNFYSINYSRFVIN